VELTVKSWRFLPAAHRERLGCQHCRWAKTKGERYESVLEVLSASLDQSVAAYGVGRRQIF
jgi:hypothetical protein